MFIIALRLQSLPKLYPFPALSYYYDNNVGDGISLMTSESHNGALRFRDKTLMTLKLCASN